MIPETHTKSPGRTCPIHFEEVARESHGNGCAVGARGGCFEVWDGVLMSESSSESQNKPTIVQPCSLKL